MSSPAPTVPATATGVVISAPGPRMLAGDQLQILHPGRGTGPLLVLSEPLSLWGGLDPVSGRIILAGHPQHGQVVTGRVMAMAGGRGSSSSSSVLAEAIRLGTAPAALVLSRPDPILPVGAAVAALLYGQALPVVVAPALFAAGTAADGDIIAVEAALPPGAGAA